MVEVPDDEPRTLLDRALSPFTEVRGGEAVTALLLALNVFLLLGGYYLLKPAREALILTEGGAVVAAYTSAAMSLLLFAVVPFYGWVASRVPRIRLIGLTAFFFASNLLVFSILGQAGVPIGIAFFIWLGIYSVFIVSQFWAFANDVYSSDQGRRLFPIVGIGMSLGGWIGAAAVEPLVEGLAFTPYTLMLAGAAVLLVAFGITHVINRRVSRPQQPEAGKTSEAPLDRRGGFELVRKDRYLASIGILILLLNTVNTTGEFVLRQFVEAAAAAGAADLAGQQRIVTLFYGSFYTIVNLLGLLLQMFVTSRAIRYLGVGRSLFILPVIALFNYTAIALVPLLAVIRVGKILENSTDYSINNTVRHALFLPTSREAKYKAKAAVDTLGQRLGDVLSAVVVGIGSLAGLGIAGFALVNVAMTAGWVGVARQIAKEHRQRSR